MAKRVAPPLNPDRSLQAYVIGLAIGDGNLTNPNGRAVRLRITCDTKYPALISRISRALTELLPKNKVSIVRGNGNYVNVSVYSNHLLANQVHAMMCELGYRPRLYSTYSATSGTSRKFQVRLSKHVLAFLGLVQPVKA